MNSEINRLTGLTQDEWFQMVLDHGIEFLEQRMSNPQWVSAISTTGIYWSWFKNQWQLTDAKFIATWGQFEVNAKSQVLLRKEYSARHANEAMIATPGANVMAQGYAKMMGEAISQVVKEAQV